MMMVSMVEAIAAFLMYLLGGALVLFIYEAYARTGQKNLMYMALGFFLVIFGGNLNTLNALLPAVAGSAFAVEDTVARTAALLIQLTGISALLYSALNPYAS